MEGTRNFLVTYWVSTIQKFFSFLSFSFKLERNYVIKFQNVLIYILHGKIFFKCLMAPLLRLFEDSFPWDKLFLKMTLFSWICCKKLARFFSASNSTRWLYLTGRQKLRSRINCSWVWLTTILVVPVSFSLKLSWSYNASPFDMFKTRACQLSTRERRQSFLLPKFNKVFGSQKKSFLKLENYVNWPILQLMEFC